MSDFCPVEAHNNKVWARYIEVLTEEGLDDFHSALVRGSFHVGERLEDFVLLLLDVCGCAGRAIAYPDGDPVIEGRAEDWSDVDVLGCRTLHGGPLRLLPRPANDR